MWPEASNVLRRQEAALSSLAARRASRGHSQSARSDRAKAKFLRELALRSRSPTLSSDTRASPLLTLKPAPLSTLREEYDGTGPITVVGYTMVLIISSTCCGPWRTEATSMDEIAGALAPLFQGDICAVTMRLVL